MADLDKNFFKSVLAEMCNDYVTHTFSASEMGTFLCGGLTPQARDLHFGLQNNCSEHLLFSAF